MVFYHFDDSTLARARTGSRVLWYPAHGDQCFSHQSYFAPPPGTVSAHLRPFPRLPSAQRRSFLTQWHPLSCPDAAWFYPVPPSVRPWAPRRGRPPSRAARSCSSSATSRPQPSMADTGTSRSLVDERSTRFIVPCSCGSPTPPKQSPPGWAKASACWPKPSWCCFMTATRSSRRTIPAEPAWAASCGPRTRRAGTSRPGRCARRGSPTGRMGRPSMPASTAVATGRATAPLILRATATMACWSRRSYRPKRARRVSISRGCW